MTTALTIKTRHETDYTIVTVAGPIDITTVAGLRERLFELAVTGQPLIADLDQVGFIDSTGLGVLVGTAKRAASAGGMLQVVSAQSNIRKLFRITGLDSEIPLAHTLEEAQQALAARAAPERQ
jgi:anti-sigma B factor antagonist